MTPLPLLHGAPAWKGSRSWLLALVVCVAACAPVVLAKNDWATKFRGSGTIETRVWNQSQEPITVRIEDFYDHIVAQVPLDPGARESIYLPAGNVRAIVHVVRGGVARESGSGTYNVAGDTIGVEWRFFPPPE